MTTNISSIALEFIIIFIAVVVIRLTVYVLVNPNFIVSMRFLLFLKKIDFFFFNWCSEYINSTSDQGFYFKSNSFIMFAFVFASAPRAKASAPTGTTTWLTSTDIFTKMPPAEIGYFFNDFYGFICSHFFFFLFFLFSSISIFLLKEFRVLCIINKSAPALFKHEAAGILLKKLSLSTKTSNKFFIRSGWDGVNKFGIGAVQDFFKNA